MQGSKFGLKIRNPQKTHLEPLLYLRVKSQPFHSIEERVMLEMDFIAEVKTDKTSISLVIHIHVKSWFLALDFLSTVLKT